MFRRLHSNNRGKMNKVKLQPFWRGTAVTAVMVEDQLVHQIEVTPPDLYSSRRFVIAWLMEVTVCIKFSHFLYCGLHHSSSQVVTDVSVAPT